MDNFPNNLFIDHAEAKRYRFNLRHLKQFITLYLAGNTICSAKGDWEVGITLDTMECAKQADVVVLASENGDFDLLVNKIRNYFGVEVEVYGVPKLTAQSLI